MRPLVFSCSLLMLATLLPACDKNESGGEGATPSECLDGTDNDGDGFTDCDDDGCLQWPSCSDTSGDADTDTDSDTDTDLDGPLTINEFMASNATVLADESGAYPDWIELRNLTATAVNLEDYTITDDLKETDKFVFSAELSVEANGYLVLFADGDTKEGPDHLSFSLSRGGESLGLYNPAGSALCRLNYPEQATDWSAARLPDGTGEWAIDSTPTPGTMNQ